MTVPVGGLEICEELHAKLADAAGLAGEFLSPLLFLRARERPGLTHCEQLAER
jgi:hypothetical protein